MATSDDKIKKGEWLRRWLDFIFGFRNKKGEVLDAWIASAEGFSYSSKEFYDLVLREMEKRKIPSMTISEEQFQEGGLLSDERVYLRLMRERLALVTCAAPFGNYFFFSCRTVYIPALVRLWHILAAILFFYLTLKLLVVPLGGSFAVIALVALVFALAGVMRNASSGGFSDLDTLLLRPPIVATIYEDWFREETYYRQDTRTLYLQVLPQLINELAQHVSGAKGVKLEKRFEPKMIVADLNQPIFPTKAPTLA